MNTFFIVLFTLIIIALGIYILFLRKKNADDEFEYLQLLVKYDKLKEGDKKHGSRKIKNVKDKKSKKPIKRNK